MNAAFSIQSCERSRDTVSHDIISRRLIVPNAERIFVRHPDHIGTGFTIEEIFTLTKIDRGFSSAD